MLEPGVIRRIMMRSRYALGAVLVSLAAFASDARAQSVPMPVPAPQPKIVHPFIAAPAASSSRAGAVRPNPKRVAQMTGATTVPAPPAAAPAGRLFGTARQSGTTAFDANQRALVDRVNTYLTSLNSLVGNFVQVGPDGSRTEGRFYLQKPGKVRFEYNPPSPLELIADGSSVVVRDRKLATQDLYPLSQTPLRFLVADRIDLLKDTNVVSASADDTFATVVIEERQTFGGTHRLMMMFGARDFQLRQWTVTDPQGYDTTVALYNLDSKQKPDPALFKIDYTRYNQ
jgi:outer membrane lipoprotein-sorting protein